MNDSTALPSSAVRTPPGIIAGIIAVSAAASAFICWLVYFHAPTDVTGTQLRSLPLVNAVLNALSTIALLAGYRFIRARQIPRHRAAMFTAFFFSSIFLVSYLGIFTVFGGVDRQGPHTNSGWLALVLAMGCLPTGTLTLVLAFTKLFADRHR